MDLGLSGKTIVITGGPRGIGRAVAELFAAEGAKVAICARDGDRVADVVKRMETNNVQVFEAAVDIADAQGLQAFIHAAATALDGIDVYVANASSLVEGNGEAEWRKAFESDVIGALNGAAAVGPYLEAAAAAKGDTSFLAISATRATEVGAPGAYFAMKAALTSLMKGFAREYAPKKVRFNSISQRLIYDEEDSLVRMRLEKPEDFSSMQSLIPVGGMGAPNDVAAMALFLSSPWSSFTTGANIVIDGSMSTRVNF
jgi:3-oxoacyl-[acyl-carrier protein] reductase